MKEEDAIKELEQILDSFGFKVERVPEAQPQRRPDIRVSMGTDVYLIEQKSKGDNPIETEQHYRDLDNLDVVTRTKKLQPRGVFSAILKDAILQIEDHPEASAASKIVWFTTWGQWKSANRDVIFKVVYGSQHVFDVNARGSGIRDCYYLNRADFKRYSEIDAVVIFDGDSFQMLVNEFSPRYHAFLSSELVNKFRQGTHDPQEAVRDGDAYSLRDYDGDRSDVEEGLNALAMQLGVERMMVMPMSLTQVSSSLNRFR